ncbi:MAG TPA: 30S ribosome-binding factor RbfA [Chroococcales cyanobacterium]|jgi:ribosome-binding factor A
MSQQRADRVAEAIKREISDLIQQGRIKDVRVSGLISITDVEVSGDLHHAKVYVSIFGEADAQQQTMEGLQSAVGFIRSVLGKNMTLRFTPELHFMLDQSAERFANIDALLNRIKQGESEKPEGNEQSEENPSENP